MSKIIKITPKMEKEKHFIWDKKLQCVKCVSCGYSKYQCKCSLLEGLKMGGVLIKDIRELIVEFIEIDHVCYNCKKIERRKGEGDICDECLEYLEYLEDLDDECNSCCGCRDWDCDCWERENDIYEKSYEDVYQ